MKWIYAMALASLALSTPAHAATLTATDNFASLDVDFVVEFDDLNGNGLLDINEITNVIGFSYLGLDADILIGIPDITGISVAGTIAGSNVATAAFPDGWNFADAADPLIWTISGGTSVWSYTLDFSDDTAPVPLPAGAPLLFAALGGLAFMRRKARG